MTVRGIGPVELSKLDWLLARAVSAEARVASEAWRDWRTVADIDSVPDHAHPFLVALGAKADEVLLGEESGRLRGLHRRSWYVNQRLGALAATTVEALDAAGVRTMLFGSLSTALRSGGEPGWRHATGIDLLVKHKALECTSAILAHAGLSLERRASRRITSVLCFADTQGNLLRLHRVLPHVGAFGIADDSMWERSTWVDVSGRDIVALSPPDALVLAAAPRLGSSVDDAAWPLDVHYLAHEVSMVDSWDDVVTAVERTPWGRLVADALGMCQEQLGTHVPDKVLERLTDLPGPSPLVRFERWARWRHAQLRHSEDRSSGFLNGA